MLRGVFHVRSFPRFRLRDNDFSPKGGPSRGLRASALRARTAGSTFAGSWRGGGAGLTPGLHRERAGLSPGPRWTRCPEPPVKAGVDGAGWWSDPGPGLEEWGALDGKRR